MLNPFEAVEDIVVNNFSEEAANKFREKVMRRSMIDPVQPIIVYINSYGGSADALSAMIATMRQVPNKIVTVAIGKAMSCGAILLSAGDFRFCDKDARVMIHEVQGFIGGDVHKIEEGSTETIRLNKHWLGFLAENCGLKDYAELRELIKERDSQELWFDAPQAKEFGIVDFVGMPAIKPFILFDIGCVSYDRSPHQDVVDPDNLEGEGSEKKTSKKKVTKKTSKKTAKKTTKKVAKKATKKTTKKKVAKKVATQPSAEDPLEALKKLFPGLTIEE